MDAIECILSRRSIRSYREEPIPEDHVSQLLRAAMNAPSARNTQPWHFVVIRQRSALDRLAEIHPYGKMLKEAGLAIAVCADGSRQPRVGYQALDCAAATQNILLAAHALGLGAVWLGIHPRKERIQALSSFLGLPPGIRPISLVSIGIPSAPAPEIDRFDASRIHAGNW